MADDSTEPTPVPIAERRDAPGRSPLRTAALALASVLVVVSVVSTWVSVQALDTNAWVDQSEELIDDPRVRELLATFLVDELFARLDVAGDLEARLPDGLGAVALPLTVALRSSAIDGVERLVASDRFRQLWVGVNERAHTTMVAILRGDDLPAVDLTDGAVVLDLDEMLRLTGEFIGLPPYLLDALPSDAGQITVFRADELDAARGLVGLLDTLSWLTFLVAIACFAAAVHLSGRRVESLALVGWCLAGAGVVVLVVRSMVVHRAVDALVDNAANEPAATFVASATTSLIAQLAWVGVIDGLVIVALAALLGSHRHARRVRRVLAPFLHGSMVAFVLTVLVTVFVVYQWSPGGAFDRRLPALVSAVLVVGGLVALRRAPVDIPVRHTFEATTNARPPKGPRAEWG